MQYVLVVNYIVRIPNMKELVAQRVPPGDRWVLLEEENDVVYG